VHSAAEVAAMKTWATHLMQRCEIAKPERRRRSRFIGNVVEDLSRLLAPLL
jgi:hypothetical protein